MTRRRPKRWLRRVAQLLLVAIVTWALYRALDLSFAELDRVDFGQWRPALWPLAGSAVVLTAVYFLHALLWRRITTDIAGRRPSVRSALRVYFLANLGRYLPGKVWQAGGYAVLARGAGVPGAAALAAAAFAQLSFLITGALVFFVLLPRRAGPLPIVGGVGIVVLLAGLLYWVGIARSGARLRGWMVRRFGDRAAAVIDSIRRLRARDVLIWLAGYTVSWLVLGAAFVLFVYSFVPAAAAEPGYLAGSLAAAYIGGYLVLFAPAGVGVREGMLGVLLVQVMPAPAAMVVSVGSRVWFTATELVPLALLPWLRRGDQPTNDGNTVLEAS